MTKKIHLIAAARPNFMKVAPLYHALVREDWCEPRIVHTGQHYDYNMSDAFFSDLDLPSPHRHLGIGSGSHAEQTGGVMIEYEKVCVDERPDCVVVVGDVNSTVACALVAAKLGIPCVHLEAGLRSRDRTMPEEINRLATDAIADLLWTPSPDADANLRREGHADDKIERIGNVMIDSFEMLRTKIEASSQRRELGIAGTDYAVVTLHRPSNVDDPNTLTTVVTALEQAAERLPLVFVAHPRTTRRLKDFNLEPRLIESASIRLLAPLPYIDFMNVVTGSSLVVTDSGGLQEETTYLGIPCLTLRANTERPITVEEGTNRLVRPEELRTAIDTALNDSGVTVSCPDRWDGQAARRAAVSLKRFLSAER